MQSQKENTDKFTTLRCKTSVGQKIGHNFVGILWASVGIVFLKHNWKNINRRKYHWVIAK